MHPIEHFWQKSKTSTPLALKDSRQTVSNNGLFSSVNALTDALRRNGLKRQERVAVLCGKSVSQVISMLSLWNLQAVYVPISLLNPQARLDYILRDCDIRTVLIETQSTLKQFQLGDRNIICVADHIQTASSVFQQPRMKNVLADDLAYIIYTSGTTGQPKGVMIDNAALGRLTQSADEHFTELTSSDTYLQVLDFSFDVSIWDTTLWLVKGGTLLTVEIDQNMFKLIKLMLEHKPAYICNAATTYALLMSAKSIMKDSDFSYVKSVITTACCCPPKIAREILKTFPRANVYNCYGPTETTIYCCWTKLRKESISLEKPVSIGHVLPGLKAHLFDGVRLHTPHSVKKELKMELCISGTQVFRGYWKAELLTKKKILINSKGERVYRTGDLVTRMGNEFYYCGRTDDTIKIKGHRVNLGEIELCLGSVKWVAHCAVVELPVNDYDFYLVAFYTIKAGKHLLADAEKDVLIKHCRIHLPSYMLPKRFIKLDKFPISIAGKIDRSHLRSQIETESKKASKRTSF